MKETQPLRIVLIGYGRMGKMIEQIAKARGHDIILTIDRDQIDRFDSEVFFRADVAIEFTTPHTAGANCLACIERGVPVVCGTTGWAEELSLLRSRIGTEGGTLFWASNFSLGVNLFFEISSQVSRLMSPIGGYSPLMTEKHHIHKLDAPSGTAITLAEHIISASDQHLTDWCLVDSDQIVGSQTLPITSIREGEVPGIHTIEYRSEVDRITLSHEAFGREGFALGAVLAAEYTSTHSGLLGMQDLLSDILSR